MSGFAAFLIAIIPAVIQILMIIKEMLDNTVAVRAKAVPCVS